MGRISRTATPSGAPYRWEDFVEADGERVVENELVACLESGCATQAQFDMAMAEVEVVRDRAAAGRLTRPDVREAKPVHLDPELWELRWDINGRPLRMYHAEPAADPTLLLCLKAHWKRTNGTYDEVKAAQNQQMLEASQRYRRSRFHPDA